MSDYSDLLLPFGETAEGRMMPADMVPRGAACGCFCPQCHRSLVAKHGEVRRHHFAHASDGCGGGALETALHKMSKQIVVDAGKIWLPEIAVSYPTPYRADVSHYIKHTAAKAGWFRGTPSPEVTIGDLRPDVVLTNDAHTVALEMFVAHAVPAEKRLKVQEAKLDMVEIDLSRHPRGFEMAVLKGFVLESAPRFWVYSGVQVAAQIVARDLWIAENDRRERIKLEAMRQAALAAARAQEHAEHAALVAAEAVRLRQQQEAEEQRVRIEAAARRAALLEIPPDAMRRAALMRPRRWAGPNAFPTAGAWCGNCESTAWARTWDGWGCSRCEVTQKATGEAA